MRSQKYFGTVSYFSLVIGIASAWSATSALAQVNASGSNGSSGVETVEVTANRNGATSAMNIPVAVTAASAQDLSNANIDGVQDLQKIDPALNVISYGPGQSRFVIRGVDSPIGSTTGLYLDEAPVLGGGLTQVGDGKPSLQLHDIDHVEVLKGPQGTLFGAGSMSGTVRAIPAAPDLTVFGGHAEISAAGVDGGDPLLESSLTVNVPIVTDELALRAVVWGDSGGGFIDQTIGGVQHKNVNDDTTKGLRVSGLWQATDQLAVTISETSQAIGVPGTIAWQSSLGAYNSNVPTIEQYKDNYNLLQGKAEYDLGFGNVVASASYGNQEAHVDKDTTPTNFAFGIPLPAVFSQDFDYHDLSTEVRFASKFQGPFQLVAGYYHLETVNSEQDSVITANPSTGVAPCYTVQQCNAAGLRTASPANPYEFGTQTEINTSETAIYAQGDYKILPTVTATVGFRYYFANQRQNLLNLQTVFPDYAFGIVDSTTLSFSGKAHQDHPSYNYSLLWEATDNVNVYVRAASGFRIGGVNSSTTLAQSLGITLPPTYNPDHLWNYEAGVKSSFFDNRLTIDASVYRIDWFGEQLNAAAASNAVTYTVNGGNTATNGGEIQVKYKPIDALSLGGSLTYVDSFLTQNLPAAVSAAGTLGQSGDTLPFTAHLSWSLNGEYDRPVMEGWDGYLGLGLNYRGDEFSTFRQDPTGALPYTKLPAYITLDARLGVRSGAWDVALFGENLSNEVVYGGVYDAPPGNPRVFSPPPRTIGIKVSTQF